MHGTEVHTALKGEVQGLGDPNLNREVSYVNGVKANSAPPGSVRVNAVDGPLDQPDTIFDLKTGNAS